MDPLPYRILTALFILVVSLELTNGWRIQVNRMNPRNAIHISRRQKREWVVPPVMMREEEDNSYRNPIAKVYSDIAIKQLIMYRCYGKGIDEPPYGIFVMDPMTGNLNVTGIVDREQIPVFYLYVDALTMSNVKVEKTLELRVRVMDINDNPPIFTQSVFVGSVEELSAASTLVMQVNATDADEPGSLNSKIAYKMISQMPAIPQMFIVNQHSGAVYTMSSYLDREAQSSYNLIVGGADLDGGAGGMSSQCGANIKILDVNDNFPSFEQSSYSVNILENQFSESLLRMKVIDLDEEFSYNWLAMCDIVSGNEGGWFAIETDAATNEAVLKVIKALDYEDMQTVNLGIILRNQAEFHHSIASQYHAVPTIIKVVVQNVKEGFQFQPSSKVFVIPSGMTREQWMNYIIGSYTATDLDTGKPATNVIYAKGRDPENWLIINSKTGEIKFSKEISRDSQYVVNGTYAAEILAISDDGGLAKTSTGTIVINVPGTNQHCPTLSTEPRYTCFEAPSVDITAIDNDPAPYGPPFTYSVVGNSAGLWTIETINATSVRLVSRNKLSGQSSSVFVSVKDNTNQNCNEPFEIPVLPCTCGQNNLCQISDPSKATDRGASLGPAAIGLMVMGALILLLIPLLLLLCSCGKGGGGGFMPVPDASEGAIQAWGIEGAHPEDRDVSHMHIPGGTMDHHETADYSDIYSNTHLVGGAGALLGAAAGAGGYGINERSRREGHGFSTTSGRAESMAGGTLREGGGLNPAFLNNYFSEKATTYANEDESRPTNDCLLIYDNEGIGSPVGSIGCCSFIDEDLDDNFLDTLGPKFKTLAEICIGKEIVTEVIESRPPIVPDNLGIDSNFTLSEPNMVVRETPNIPPPIGNSTVVTESTYTSRPGGFQPAMPIPDSLVPGNVVVTETYTTSGHPRKPPPLLVNPRQPNVVVTERVLRPASGLGGMIDIPDLTDGSNVVVTERVVHPGSGLGGMLDIPDLADGSVVVRERVIAPSGSRLSNSFSIPDLRDVGNVVVTERVIQPASTLQGNLTIPSALQSNLIIPSASSLQGNFTIPSASTLQGNLTIPSASSLQGNFTIPSASSLQGNFTIPSASTLQGNYTIPSDLSNAQNMIVTEKRTVSTSGAQSQILNPDPFLSQPIGSTSPNKSVSRLTKYSTVQYS
uniref:Desmoglein-4-like n=1 Tax=Geotrypetes seraphini TaxID=260995 RepID=A0A6P8QWX1_GEOSA|nr:desmoglein-4-like [Geotrypetes seraphini]